MAVNIAQLRAFLAVLDDGGFSAAADRLGISQSAVSHSIATLERALGGPVLTRQGRPRPTVFGGEILGHARAAVAATSAIDDLAARRDGLPGGSIRLGAPATVCQGLLPGLMTRWKADLPRVEVTLFEGEDDEVADWLLSRAVDLAVLVDPASSSAGVPVGRDAFEALLPGDHPLAGEAEISVADLEDDPFLLSCGGCERHVRDLHRRAGVAFTPAHRVRDMGTLLAMVRSGIGVSIVPGLACGMLDARLVLVPLAERTSRRLVLTGPPGQPWHPAAGAVVAATRQAQDVVLAH